MGGPRSVEAADARRARRIFGYGILAVGASLTIYCWLTVFMANGWLLGDANTYLAAGERLNAGHPLYYLSSGDRSVAFEPWFAPVALASPPPIAAIWRLLAALGPETGVMAWETISILSLLTAIGMLAVRNPVATGAMLVVLALPLSGEITGGNVNPLLTAALIASWFQAARGHDTKAGILIGAAAAIKIWPFVAIAWFVGQRRWQGLVGAFAGCAGVLVLGALGAGFGAYPDYLGALQSIGISPNSLSYLIGASWVGYAILALGTIGVVIAGPRPRASWALAILAMVLGSPVIHLGTLTVLFAAIAPIAWPLREPARRSGSDKPARGANEVVAPSPP